MYNIPAYNQFQFDRAQQINELLVSLGPQCRTVNPDRSLLEVPVRLNNGATIALRINVPAGFPQEKPVLSVMSPIRHPWVDPSIGRLSFPTLDRWAGPSMRLAAVVSEAMQGLASGVTMGPPPGTAGPAQQPSPSGHPQPPAGPGQPPGNGRPPSPQKQPHLPPPRTEFPELETMSNSDLAHALTSDDAYAHMLQQFAAGPSPSEASTPAEVVRQLRSSIEAAAQRNLSREAEMAEVRNQIAIIRSSEYAPARAAYEEKAARQQQVLELLSPKVLLQKLQAGAAQAEEESEQLYRQFSEGALGAEAFVRQYTAARAVFHQRDLKVQAAQHTIPMDV